MVMLRPRSIGRHVARLLPARAALRLAGDTSGLSAVEFAIVLPIMLLLFFGAVEFGEGLTIKRKVTSVTSSLTDLVTQSKVITDSDMKNILKAASAIIVPYDENKLRIKITGINIDDKGKATVAWSDALNDTAHSKNAVVTVPTGVKIDDSFLVTTEVHYDYTPTFGYVLTGDFDLNDQYYLRPRFVSEIKRKKS